MKNDRNQNASRKSPRLRRLMRHFGGKLRYLPYEGQVQAVDAPRFAGLDGVWLQTTPGPDGRSRNSAIAALQ